MSPDNLIPLVIFGAAGLALIAGLGAWVWEIFQKTALKAPAPPANPEIKSAEELQREEQPKPPEVKSVPGLLVSKFFSPLPHPPGAPKPPLQQPSEEAPKTALPKPQEPAHEAAVEEVALNPETVKEDKTYEEALRDKVEADKPSTGLEEPEATATSEDESFFTCSGHADWTSPENDRDSSEITRAIFRNGFASLIVSFSGFSSHNWPREFKFSRETQKSFSGTARHQNISIHCTITFKALQGKNLEFDGWWQADRHDNTRYLKYRFSGMLQASRQIPDDPFGPVPAVAIRPAASATASPVDVRDILIPGRRFSIGIGQYRGKEFLEILENGRPWGETHRNAKRHFSFGRRKARMILLAGDQIRAFVASGGEDPANPPITVSSAPLLDENVTIYRESSFQIGSHNFPHPHLKLTHKNESLAFGLSKADALLTLWPQIEQWAKRN
jgi:hypothetical protein